MKVHCPCVPCAVLLCVASLVGCGKEASPPATAVAETDAVESAEAFDPHDILLTDAEIESLKGGLSSYEDALAKIDMFSKTIREAVTVGDAHQAHRPLDELDIVLEHLPTVAREHNIPKSEWETINTSAQRIRELFNQVHARIDNGESADFEGVVGEIESEIGKLAGVKTS